jgi:hypothetical protein
MVGQASSLSVRDDGQDETVSKPDNGVGNAVCFVADGSRTAPYSKNVSNDHFATVSDARPTGNLDPVRSQPMRLLRFARDDTRVRPGRCPPRK